MSATVTTVDVSTFWGSNSDTCTTSTMKGSIDQQRETPKIKNNRISCKKMINTIAGTTILALVVVLLQLSMTTVTNGFTLHHTNTITAFQNKVIKAQSNEEAFITRTQYAFTINHLQRDLFHLRLAKDDNDDDKSNNLEKKKDTIDIGSSTIAATLTSTSGTIDEEDATTTTNDEEATTTTEMSNGSTSSNVVNVKATSEPAKTTTTTSYTFLDSNYNMNSSSQQQQRQVPMTDEQSLRNEIAIKNYKSLTNEQQYSIIDGSIGDLLEDEENEKVEEKNEMEAQADETKEVEAQVEEKEEKKEAEEKEDEEDEIEEKVVLSTVDDEIVDETIAEVITDVTSSQIEEEEDIADATKEEDSNTYTVSLLTEDDIEIPQEQEQHSTVSKTTLPVEEEEKEKVMLSSSSSSTGSSSSSSSNSSRSSSSTDWIETKLPRVLKERPYPLFMMEKGAMIIDDILGQLKNFQSEDSYSTGGFGDPMKKDVTVKEKILILGTGWGAAALLKEIDLKKYDVTVVSPRNYFLFTPMLAGASVGTVEYRSITQPIRQLKPYGIGKPRFKFIEATATNINPLSQSVNCEAVVCEGNSCQIDHFTLEYDKLIVSVGAQTNTFGIPGVREYCNFLKQVEDAQRIRTAVVNCFERASLPNISEKDKRRILTFAVIGAGPTGVEFASELRDFVEQDLPNYYPKLLPYVSIKIIEASNQILAPFDDKLKQAAMKQIEKRVRLTKTDDPELYNLGELKFTELLLESGVQEVQKDVILLNNNKTVPYGVAVWAAGIGPLPITIDLINSIQTNEQHNEQTNAQSIARGRLAIDPWLRVLGTNGTIFAIGDCSCNIQNVLPATAQVASQQGEHLGRVLLNNNKYNLTNIDTNNNGKLLPPLKIQSNEETDKEDITSKVTSFAMNTNDIAPPFQFWNLGILAYTGSGSALAQLQVTPGDGVGRVKGQGKVGFSLWRSVYLSKQVSLRNRILVALDWTKTKIFGRDITRTS